MAYTIWEVLTFTPEQLKERERTMTRQERWLESGVAADRSSLRQNSHQDTHTQEKSKEVTTTHDD